MQNSEEISSFTWKTAPFSERLEDAEFIRQRIAALTAHRCEAELRQYLPEDVFQELALQEFQPLRDSLEDLFSEWLVS